MSFFNIKIIFIKWIFIVINPNYNVTNFSLINPHSNKNYKLIILTKILSSKLNKIAIKLLEPFTIKILIKKTKIPKKKNKLKPKTLLFIKEKLARLNKNNIAIMNNKIAK